MTYRRVNASLPEVTEEGVLEESRRIKRVLVDKLRQDAAFILQKDLANFLPQISSLLQCQIKLLGFKKQSQEKLPIDENGMARIYEWLSGINNCLGLNEISFSNETKKEILRLQYNFVLSIEEINVPLVSGSTTPTHNLETFAERLTEIFNTFSAEMATALEPTPSLADTWNQKYGPVGKLLLCGLLSAAVGGLLLGFTGVVTVGILASGPAAASVSLAAASLFIGKTSAVGAIIGASFGALGSALVETLEDRKKVANRAGSKVKDNTDVIASLTKDKKR